MGSVCSVMGHAPEHNFLGRQESHGISENVRGSGHPPRALPLPLSLSLVDLHPLFHHSMEHPGALGVNSIRAAKRDTAEVSLPASWISKETRVQRQVPD